ncbi:MAG: hypothetical protein OXE92_01410 [Bacteroidetes bacterium]|nr:hypothetical protein [Bacteroidota bacterium]MCY4204364.1 hypothetical protein [Bacteroidota bacterium]
MSEDKIDEVAMNSVQGTTPSPNSMTLNGVSGSRTNPVPSLFDI